ncbi:MAG: EAL domain-containing protein [Erysipelotrichaceae bacterium]|nr:EAL domain-containing protein [Erysipelotrichaceae bacterium]MBQ3994513.1 EAL domain-containing protein [Erysipelotrichaceae bacterium]MBQ5552168.1 EAL domain-containing protein [Erysipelotrichaceae bacterium]
METFKIASCERKTRRVLFWAWKEDQDIRKLSKILEADYEVFFIFDRERLFKESETAALLIIDLDEKGSRKILKACMDQKIPLILVSKQRQIEERYHYLGASAFLEKPLPDKEIILARISRAIIRYDEMHTLTMIKEEPFHYEEIREDEFKKRLLLDVERALKEEEFKVYYQPKFNIKEKVPVLSSAEALLRWHHHAYGMISPSVFIPLLEESRLIRKVDAYVWQKAARQISEWKRKKKITVPVSVNVSRVDMPDEKMVVYLEELIEDCDISSEELLLEITESAYMEDPSLIIERVKQLRKKGFLIEMDDFGTGYSSLNMVSHLPIDALKIDMGFLQEAFKGKKDTRMIAIIIDIARYLGVLTIAEGVENEDQYLCLKKLGCDIVQGYYFSKAVEPKDFERFLEDKLQIMSDEKALETA